MKELESSLEDIAREEDEEVEFDDQIELKKVVELKEVDAPTCAETKKETVVSKLFQWAISGPNRYSGVGSSNKILPAGMYRIDHDQQGIYFEKMEIQTDSWIDLPDALYKEILKEIKDFWERRDLFARFGFLHRRGYMFWGGAGCGKTVLVQHICHDAILNGDLILICENPKLLMHALITLRQIEPERQLVCVYEDAEAIAEHYDNASLLSVLDGENQINHVLNVATTNYPERLDPRLKRRPRRFDRVIKIEPPSLETRRVYLEKKLQIGNCSEAALWAEKQKGSHLLPWPSWL
jgi:hypothetical protein